MKQFLYAIGLSLALAVSSAFAADVNASLTVNNNGKPVYQQTNTFYDVTDAEAKELQASATKQLDFASKHQDKGGTYSIVWKWNDQPAVETSGMKFGAVNGTLRQGIKWLDVELLKSEKAEKAGKSKPYGK